ncbi:MAG: dihydroneopterin aldolase [Flavobacteriales bacterium]|jgi:dihydroneopterin aldolase|nr:dihydroneopterin aldolase [Flavobacteriales bacterium]
MIQKIFIRDLKIRANHGVLPEETLSGNDFVIQLELHTDFSRACRTDQLEYTVNYADVCGYIQEEMKINAQLLEHIAYRICTRIFREEFTVTKLILSIDKLNPPIHADLSSVAISIEMTKNEFENE